MQNNKKIFLSLVLIITSNCSTSPIQFLHETSQQENTIQADTEISEQEDNVITIEPQDEVNFALEEYDQEICDYTEQSKVSELTAWLRSIGISCFLKLLETKEYVSYNAKNYSQKIQVWLQKFYSKKATHHKNFK